MVLCSAWIATFLLFLALVIDVFLIGVALLQQRNAADYLSMGIVKMYVDPPGGADCSSELPICEEPHGECSKDRYNCVIQKAIAAVNVAMPGSNGSPQYSPGDFYVNWNPDDPYVSGGGNQQTEPDDNTTPWRYYDFYSPDKGEIVFGYMPPNPGGPEDFVARDEDHPGIINAVMVKLRLQNTEASPIILPMMELLAPPEALQFSSTVVAYQDGNTISLSRVDG